MHNNWASGVSRFNWLRHPLKTGHKAWEHALKTSRKAWKHVCGWGCYSFRFIRTNHGRLALFVILGVFGIGVWRLIDSWTWLSTDFWAWLRNGPDGVVESGSTTARNIGLIIAGLIALPLALWRSWVAQRQAGTAQQNLLNERYQQGAEMLGSEVLSVRLGGIYALQRLAAENPKQYHIQIMQLLCAFVRHPSEDAKNKIRRVSGKPSKHEPRGDVQEVMMLISACHAKQDRLELAADFRLDLRGVNLHDADLFKARLCRANFSKANLAGAKLIGADLARAEFSHANIAGAVLSHADLTMAGFEYAELSETKLESANLSKARFYCANLSNARLSSANLAEAHLSSANLVEAWLQESDLSKTRLQGGNLTGASLIKANLSGAILWSTNLSGASLCGANLRGANLSGANLSNAQLSPITIVTSQAGGKDHRQEVLTQLTQTQLDVARADPEKPPKLDGALDAETGKPLVWRGKPLDDATR